MIFFVFILLISLVFGFYILFEDKNFNNLLESVIVSNSDTQRNKNISVLSHSLLNQNNNNEIMNEEERKLLHISKLI